MARLYTQKNEARAELERIDTMIAFAQAQLDRAEAALRALEERAAACRRPGP